MKKRPGSPGRPARALLLLAVVGCGAGCGMESPPAEGRAGDPEGDGPLSLPAPPPETVFDPTAIEPGDPVLGLVVLDKDVHRVLEDSIWSGTVTFGGDLVLHGIYQWHFDYPDVTAPCVHVVQPASLARIPRFPPDSWTVGDEKTWFCFEDPEVALEMLGSPDRPYEVVIAVDHYRVRRVFGDVLDSAELMEVLEVGPPARWTLRDP